MGMGENPTEIGFADLTISAEGLDDTLLNPEYVAWLYGQRRVVARVMQISETNETTGEPLCMVQVAPPGYVHGESKLICGWGFPTLYSTEFEGQIVPFVTILVNADQMREMIKVVAEVRAKMEAAQVGGGFTAGI